MSRKKHSNPILDNPDNGGIHSTRRLKSVHTMMTTHGLKNAVVYEFILAGKADKGEYQATIKALVRHIRTQCRAEYVGAYEIGSEKGGLHCHCYIIIETAPQIPRYLLDVTAGHWIARRIARTGMSIKIAPPKAPMHGGAMFAKMDTPAKLADCIAWVEYHVKGRSKDGVPGREVYFASEFASNAGNREARRQKYRDALEKSSRPAAAQAIPFLPVDSSTEGQIIKKETQHDRNTTPPRGQEGPGHASTGSGGNTSTEAESPASSLYTGSSSPILVGSRSRMRVPAPSASSSPEAEAIRPRFQDGGATGPADQTHEPIARSPGTAMTPADRYIASLYEAGIGLRLDLDAIRRYLLTRGIKRTPAQVVFDLDERFCFHGYASRHPAPVQRTYAEIDKQLGKEERRSSREDRENPLPFYRLADGRGKNKHTHIMMI